ncbi:beta-flanking protein [Ceratocystis lukuohia]|uniref:Beta-flanking protein n=1 Tax=Ceratocystis lukuohia TaxID=2019550 RepID=A0ABR4MBY9_9PEZI
MDFLKTVASEYSKSQQGSGSNDAQHQQSGLSGMLLNNNLFDVLDSDADKKKTAEAAAQASGSHGNSDMFHNVLNKLNQNKHSVAQEKDNVDEDFAVKMFKKFVEKKDTSSDEKASSNNLGAAAAMQAIKMFNSGSGSGSSSSGSGGQAALLGLAMSEGSKLFDNAQAEGKVAKGTTKESVIEQAVQFALKFFLKSQTSGSSGGNSGLMGLAAKFL